MKPVDRGTRGAFVPLALFALAFVGWLGFQATQLWVERTQLAQQQAGLDAAVQNATRLRASLDGVATATAKLADAGNASARAVVEQLRQRGVTIKPNATAPAQ